MEASKIRKRIISALLTAALLLSLCSMAAASEAEFLIAAPAGGTSAGETFTVSVELNGNPGFCSVQFTLAYDASQMECTDAETGPLLSGVMAVVNPEAPDGAYVAAATLDAVRGDGTLGTVTFRAKKNLTSYSLSLEGAKLTELDGTILPFTVRQTASEEPQPEPAEPTAPTEPTEPTAPTEPAESAAPAIAFTDTKGHWAESCIGQAVEKKLFNGYPDGSFRPDTKVTRAQFITVIWRMAGSPATQAKTPFTDIAAQSAEFRTAIAWGYEKGLINGNTETTFNPTGALTREAAMKILFFYSGGISGTEIMFTGIYDSGFTDSAQISSWAKAPMYWGVYNEIISGTGKTTLSPKGTATRAQLAKILIGYLDKFQN